MSSPVPVPSDDAPQLSSKADEVIAGPSWWYRWTRYLISIGLFMGYGSRFIKDGFYTYPAEQQEAARLIREGHTPPVAPHTDLDINLNRLIGLTVPPAGVALLIWTLYNSRGRYRLADHTLYVPGHPPVPLASIRQINESKWERKGIAYIDYDVPGSDDTGRLKLDAFVYDQVPADEIMARIKAAVVPEQNAETTDADAPAPDPAAEPAEG